jgi:hypothetical protein
MSVKDITKVYFTSAAVPDDARRSVYDRVRQTLLNLGCNLTYDWLVDKEKLVPAELFKRTNLAINAADVVVAEVTFPSTGVGQQINLAMNRKIPVIVLKGDWEIPGKFTPGAQGELMQYHEYNPSNLEKILCNSLNHIKKERFVKFNFISTPSINELLEKESEALGETRSQLLRRIIRDWLVENE